MFIFLSIVLLMLDIAFRRFKELRKRVIKIFKNKKVGREHAILYSRKDAMRKEDKYTERKVHAILLVLLGGCIISELLLVNSYINPVISEENTITRPGYEEKEKKVELYTDYENSDGRQKVSFTVSEREYEQKEIEKLAEEAKEIILRDYMGENMSEDKVQNDLNLMTRVDGYPFKIQWKVDKPLLINRSGKIDKERVKKKLNEIEDESIIVNLCATITYSEYSEEISTAVKLYTPEETKSKMMEDKILEAIALENFKSKEKDVLKLPNRVEGIEIEYKEDTYFTPIIIFILSIVLAAGISMGKDNDLSRKVIERNDQMESDYPRIVNRYAMYYCAGMHPQVIWKEMCREYRNKIAKGEERRYAFEEMLKCEALINDGVGEVTALNEFASECRLKKYRTFVNLVEQALVKGKEEMKDALRREAEEAANEKLVRAKIKGEEAGTKLLLPMFMMLGVVLIIVIIPAFINFKI